MIGVKARRVEGGTGPQDEEWRCPVCGTDHDGWLTNQGRVIVVPDGMAHPLGHMGEEEAVPPDVPTVQWGEAEKDRARCYWLAGDVDSERLSAEEAGIDQ